ncbi:ribonuclease HI family protein [Variovorax sp. RHLX14]|uniref:ribonuclease HI family protein n=1 Tax=Variovorax sp. RHLX14 TaxID=1259731 RepID=UPI003F46BCEA
MTTWTVWCDGSAIPNPGRMGLGAVVVAPDGSRFELSQSPQGAGCNNEAELRAVTLALEQLKTLGATAARVYSDNSIVVGQLGGGTGPAAEPIARLAVMFDAARDLVATFESIEMVWIPRSRNAEADALARAALGVGPKQRKAKHVRR